MEPDERRFVRPSLLQLVDALDEAAGRVNAGGAVLDIDRDGWEEVLAGIRGTPEGVRQWPGVRLAWWTDAGQRRHFLVRAADTGDKEFRVGPNVLPPVLHLFPDAVYGVGRGPSHPRKSRWVTVCACGVMGEPGQIGWMGPCCKACFDHGRDPGHSPPRRRHFHRQVQHLAFSPDGRHIGICPTAGSAHVWDVMAKDAPVEWNPGRWQVWRLHWGPGGRQLYLACQDRMLRVIAWPGGEELQAVPMPHGAVRVVISPDDRALALASERTVELWGREHADQPWTFQQELPGADAAAFSPDGRFMRSGGRYLVLYHKVLDAWEVDRRGPCWGGVHRLLMFQPGGESVVTSVGRIDLPVGRPPPSAGSREHTWYLRQCWRADLPEGVLSPDAEWLAAAGGPGPVLLHLLDPQRTYTLHAGSTANVVSLAFSPDGHTLATGHADGCVQLWPWRRLVEG